MGRYIANRAVGAVAALALALVCTGCGGSSSSVSSMKPTAAAVASIQAFNKASSVRVSTTQRAGNSVDIEITNRGGKGTISRDGFREKVLSVGRYVYWQPSAAYLKHYGGAAAVKTYAGVWLRGLATKGNWAKLASTLNKRYFGKPLEAAIREPIGSATKETPTTIDGRAAVPVTNKAHSVTLYIAAKGTPFLLAVADKGHPTTYLSGYDRPVSLVPPARWINET
ncbi:MAG: hypothetical protein ACRDLT_08130 [Solirubrobacteraceae bacterium]